MKSRNTKFLIWGYYGFGNLGDELMLSVIVRRIHDVYHSAPVYVVCKNIPAVKNIFPVIKLISPPFVAPIINFFILLAAILKVDNLIIGGGTLFLDKGKHSLSIMMLCIMVFCGRAFGKKIYVVGVGIDKVSNLVNVGYLKYILRNSEFVSVRDSFSFEAAGNLVGLAAIKKTSDMLFEKGFVKSLLANNIEEKKYIILALFNYSGIAGDKEKGKLFRERSLKLIEDLIKKWGNEYKIALCALQYKEGGRDYEFLSELRDSILKDSPFFEDRLIVQYLDREDQVREYFGKAVFVISDRYHALVLSAISGTPFMGIQVGVKISEMCNEFNMPIIKESEYVGRGIGIHDLDLLKTMIIKKELLSQNTKKAEYNFEWIR